MLENMPQTLEKFSFVYWVSATLTTAFENYKRRSLNSPLILPLKSTVVNHMALIFKIAVMFVNMWLIGRN